jgi:hypothetical protein
VARHESLFSYLGPPDVIGVSKPSVMTSPDEEMQSIESGDVWPSILFQGEVADMDYLVTRIFDHGIVPLDDFLVHFLSSLSTAAISMHL